MASLNLLASYGSDDSQSSSETTGMEVATLHEIDAVKTKNNFFQALDDSSSGEEVTDDISCSHTIEQIQNLKNPFRNSEIPSGPSVFANPYKEAEDAEKGTLEKHVKFAPKLEDVKEINGRKICWNYRKGRCRFGSNCVFAHDSELLQKNVVPDSSGEHVISSPDFDLNTSVIQNPGSTQTKRSVSFKTSSLSESAPKKKRR